MATRPRVPRQPKRGTASGPGPDQVAVRMRSHPREHRGSRDSTLVLVVRDRESLLTQVIPFFERQPLLSSKQQEFVTFAAIVRSMARGEHLDEEGFRRIRALAISMNGGGRYRRVHRV
jgi:hypothetical protein